MADFEFLDTSCQFLTWTVVVILHFEHQWSFLDFGHLCPIFAVVADFEFRTSVSEFGIWTIVSDLRILDTSGRFWTLNNSGRF